LSIMFGLDVSYHCVVLIYS